MTIRVGINGFGRIGRLAMRCAWNSDLEQSGAWGGGTYDLVHVNEVNGGAETGAHLLKFDSIHGRWPVVVRSSANNLYVDDKLLSFSSKSKPAEVDWGGLGVDLVIEASGKFKSEKELKGYFDSGVRKVVVACPVRDGDALNVVMGINDHLYNPTEHNLVTAASCTTNCLAPVVKVLHEAVGIKHGQITTIHDATNTQTVVDKPHEDLRRARSSLLNLIPTSTGSASAIGLIFPELQGKLNGVAVRVPLLNASLTDAVFEMENSTEVDRVNDYLRKASQGPLSGILGFKDSPLVSSDYRGDTRSCIVDGLSTMVVNGTQVKVLAWYDNEMGYANRLVELVKKIALSMDKRSGD
ncbi:MAG: type I glyceraldehyde-3-phosphate dehydrogenase [Rhodospirillaceae bacterium]|nr:type I glyceraldehyde-3-phosphate dehydrogenase [Rhodospirillaceae bacterium]